MIKRRRRLNFVNVAAPSGGEDVPQWRRMRVALNSGKSGEKRRGIEAIVGT